MNHIESEGNSLSWKNVIGTVPCDHDGGGRGALTLEGNAGMCQPSRPLTISSSFAAPETLLLFFHQKIAFNKPHFYRF